MRTREVVRAIVKTMEKDGHGELSKRFLELVKAKCLRCAFRGYVGKASELECMIPQCYDGCGFVAMIPSSKEKITQAIDENVCRCGMYKERHIYTGGVHRVECPRCYDFKYAPKNMLEQDLDKYGYEIYFPSGHNNLRMHVKSTNCCEYSDFPKEITSKSLQVWKYSRMYKNSNRVAVYLLNELSKPKMLPVTNIRVIGSDCIIERGFEIQRKSTHIGLAPIKAKEFPSEIDLEGIEYKYDSIEKGVGIYYETDEDLDTSEEESGSSDYADNVEPLRDLLAKILVEKFGVKEIHLQNVICDLVGKQNTTTWNIGDISDVLAKVSKIQFGFINRLDREFEIFVENREQDLKNALIGAREDDVNIHAVCSYGRPAGYRIEIVLFQK